MTSVDIAPAAPIPTPASRKSAKTAQVGRRVRTAIELMVWHGHQRDEAAKAAGMLPKSLYNALRRPQVKRLYMDELDVLRTSERARNIHALVDVRDQKGNHMARVNAVKALEQIADEPAANASRNRMPGLVVNIISDSAHTAHIREMEANPLIEHEDGRHVDTERHD